MGRRVRTREPVREQGTFLFEVPDDAVPANHPARLLWRVIETLDLSRFLKDARAIEGRQGRDVTSVRVLLTLWLYAIHEGIQSAREIERRIASDTAFRWICGDMTVGRTTLADFRVEHAEALDALFTQVLGRLLQRKLVSLDLVAQDGTRVRASASAPSFRRERSLRECEEQAALHLKAVRAEGESGEFAERIRRAREAKALDYQQRVAAAIAEIAEIQASRAPTKRLREKSVRASTTDPEARVMKMPDGGFRPAYNVQLATTGDPEGGPRTIVGVRVTNVGSDMGSITPMLDQIERRAGSLPDVLLADGNHASHECIRACVERGVKPILPVPDVPNPRGCRADHDEPIAAWRRAMATDEAKALYRARASIAELPNAHFKSRLGLGHLLVRGLGKVTCVALLTALAANLAAHAAALLA